MEAKAMIKTVRVAPRKARLVVDLIRGKKIGDALATLKMMPNIATEPLTKVVKSAVANADNNYQMDVEKLFIKEIYVNEGPTLKRMRPRAKGSGNRILKRTSHITCVVAEMI